MLFAFNVWCSSACFWFPFSNSFSFFSNLRVRNIKTTLNLVWSFTTSDYSPNCGRWRILNPNASSKILLDLSSVIWHLLVPTKIVFPLNHWLRTSKITNFKIFKKIDLSNTYLVYRSRDCEVLLLTLFLLVEAFVIVEGSYGICTTCFNS